MAVIIIRTHREFILIIESILINIQRKCSNVPKNSSKNSLFTSFAAFKYYQLRINNYSPQTVTRPTDSRMALSLRLTVRAIVDSRFVFVPDSENWLGKWQVGGHNRGELVASEGFKCCRRWKLMSAIMGFFPVIPPRRFWRIKEVEIAHHAISWNTSMASLVPNKNSAERAPIIAEIIIEIIVKCLRALAARRLRETCLHRWKSNLGILTSSYTRGSRLCPKWF